MIGAAHEVVLLTHAFATLAMCGLCWFVQVVHYPLFAAVGAERFMAYESAHVRRTTCVVAPLMLAELVGGGVILAITSGEIGSEMFALAALNAALLAVVWASTFGVQVPIHARLQREFSERDVRRLVATNWVRTAAWSAKGIVALALLVAGSAS